MFIFISDSIINVCNLDNIKHLEIIILWYGKELLQILRLIIDKILKLGMLLRLSIKLLIILILLFSWSSKYSKLGNLIDEFWENKGIFIEVLVFNCKIFKVLKDFIGIYKLLLRQSILNFVIADNWLFSSIYIKGFLDQVCEYTSNSSILLK